MSTEIMTRALQFATTRHAQQRRKYTDLPYITHLEAVVAILRDHDINDPTTLAAAYLHDVVEDTQTTIQELILMFGESVAELVYWLSDLEKGNRAARVLQSCWRLSRAPMPAKVIKCADIIDNSSTIAEYDPKFAATFNREKSATLQMMAAIEGPEFADLRIFRKAVAASTVPSEGR